MSYAKSHNRKVRKVEARLKAGKPLRRWELERFHKDGRTVMICPGCQSQEIIDPEELGQACSSCGVMLIMVTQEMEGGGDGEEAEGKSQEAALPGQES